MKIAHKLLSVLACLLISAVLPFTPAALSGGSALRVKKDVPYVPTPHKVVAEMLRMADVKEGDILYDLGCGDGRIVITAARDRGARGIGVDIDPQRILESKSNAENAGVTDRVRFQEGDLFEMDFAEASVLALYLLPDINIRLRPKILRELAPGSRVVSHDFDMDDWKPDATSKMRSHDIYLWIVPANAGGRWEWSGSGRADGEEYRLDLVQSFQKISGNLYAASPNLPVTGNLRGDLLRIEVDEGDGLAGPLVFEGRVVGDRIHGKMRQAAGAVEPWTARRDPVTKTALDGE